MQIGARVKSLRKRRGVTLKQVAERTGLSIGYLSNIERDLTSPTVDHLEVIAKALDTAVSSILEPPRTHAVIRRDERELIYDIPNRARWEYIVSPKQGLTGICTELAPHGEAMTSWGHNFDEVGIVAEGEVQITLGDAQYILREGDTLYVPANTGHTAQNVSDKRCVCYWVSAPERK